MHVQLSRRRGRRKVRLQWVVRWQMSRLARCCGSDRRHAAWGVTVTTWPQRSISAVERADHAHTLIIVRCCMAPCVVRRAVSGQCVVSGHVADDTCWTAIDARRESPTNARGHAERYREREIQASSNVTWCVCKQLALACKTRVAIVEFMRSVSVVTVPIKTSKLHAVYRQ